jgi:hypothetical protein
MWSTGQALPLNALDSLYNAHQTSRRLTTHILWRKRSLETWWEEHSDVMENLRTVVARIFVQGSKYFEADD